MVERALAAGCRPFAALADAERLPAVADDMVATGVECSWAAPTCDVSSHNSVCPNRSSRCSTARRVRRPPSSRPDASDWSWSKGVDNPVNIGSIVRNAAALGWDGLLLDHTSADPLARRALRVAMGTAFSLPLTLAPSDLVGEVTALVQSELRGVRIDTRPRRSRHQDRPTGRTPGARDRGGTLGLSDAVLDAATPVRIPMAEFGRLAERRRRGRGRLLHAGLSCVGAAGDRGDSADHACATGRRRSTAPN